MKLRLKPPRWLSPPTLSSRDQTGRLFFFEITLIKRGGGTLAKNRCITAGEGHGGASSVHFCCYDRAFYKRALS